MKTAIQKKVCLLGDVSVGKTSLVERFVYNRFEERHLATIGVNISRKTVELEVDLHAQLLIWDLAGGDEDTQKQTSYLLGATGALVVCDLTRANTLIAVEKYARRLRSFRENAPIIVVANKADLIDQCEIKDSLLEGVARQLQAPIQITSAKTGAGVDDAFRTLAAKVIRA